MKRLIVILLAVSLMTSCAGVRGEEKLKIVATTFPQYDWLRNIMGDRADSAEISLLVGGGSDIHSYQPSAKDIITISSCDMIIYVGGTSDTWVADALKSAMNPNIDAISMLGLVEAREEELVTGMQNDEEHDHPDEGIEYDEHVWLSLRCAKTVCLSIAEELGRIDPDNADYYAQNTKAYIEKLDALDAKYASAVDSAKRKTVLFADRFPFRYLADDYGLEYFAAFAGCSAETEASFETVAFLAEKINEMNLPAVLVIEGGNHDLARTVVSCSDNPNRQILEMDSIQSVTDAGEDYLEIMEKNLAVLETALN